MRLRLSWIASLSLSLGLALGLAGPAPAGIGPDAVISPDEIDRLGLFDCATEQADSFAACLSARGVPQAAIDFTSRLRVDDDDMIGLLAGFTEYGAVDLATILYPAAANSNLQVAFVNGAEPVVRAADLPVPVPGTRNGRALRSHHPDWMAAGPMEFAGYRNLPDGTQRFTLIDRITEGCRACEVLAQSVVAVDFRGGRLSEVTTLDWVPPRAALEGEEALAAMQAGRMDVLQYRLILAGHDTGGVDGVMGRKSRAALEGFLSEHCLPAAPGPASPGRDSLAVIAGLTAAACD